jgi:hypothetical protein
MEHAQDRESGAEGNRWGEDFAEDRAGVWEVRGVATYGWGAGVIHRVVQNGEVHLSSTVTIARYQEMEKGQDRAGLGQFIEERLTERYVHPLQAIPPASRSGFLIMAAACLFRDA